MSDEIKDLCYIAKIAYDISQFKDMIETMKKIVKINPTLDHDQRVLLSQAYHEYVSERRRDLLVLNSCMNEITSTEQKTKMKEICDEVKTDIYNACMEVIDMVSNVLLKSTEENVTQLFYNKMEADYYRYIAEILDGDEKEKAVNLAEALYSRAIEIARTTVSSGHPIFLGLILNYCVFLVDMKNNKEAAHKLALEAMQNAEHSAEECPGHEGESEICIRILKDNLELWEGSEESES